MTARKVWEYRHEPDVYSSRMGNALRLPNGNTLLNFGAQDYPLDPLYVVEARSDAAAEWEMMLRMGNRRISRYRAYPFTTLAGEVRVSSATPMAHLAPTTPDLLLEGQGAIGY